MSQPSSLDDPREHRLEQALAEYLRSVEAGQPVDRKVVLDRYPDLADELQSFFCNRDAMQQLARPLQDAAGKIAAGDEPTMAHGVGGQEGETLANRVRYFGDYELLNEIARGGMGVVYKARQESLKRTVALKMILSRELASPDDIERFHAEAEAAANLDHPHIVPIYEVGQHEGQHYFTMKLMEGGSLAERLSRPPWPVGSRERSRWAAELISIVARAVHHAHQRRILHRDLKPANILFDGRNHPFVSDFGLAKRVAGGSDLTRSGSVVGTPAYMAPEQAAAKELTTGADIYSLGAILYELLTGQPPLRGATPLETLVLVMNQRPAPLRSFDPRLNRDLETICLKCLEKESARRYDSAAAMADDLDHWLAGEPINARAVGSVERVWCWFRRNPTRMVLAGAFAALVLLVVVTAGVGYRTTSNAMDLAQRRLYAAHISMAQAAAEAHDDGRILALLEQHVPRPGIVDLRGWEWFYERGQCRIIRSINAGRGTVTGMAWSPDGKWLASCINGPISFWDAQHGRLAFTLEMPWRGGLVNEPLAFSPDGQWLASGGPGNDIEIWEIASRRVVHRLRGHTDEVTSLAWSADSQRLASAGQDKTARIWRLADTQSELEIATQLERVQQLAWVADGKQLAIGAKLWSTTDGSEVGKLPLPALAYSQDGRRFVDGFSIYDIAGGKVVARLQNLAYDPVSMFAWSPDGKFVAHGHGVQIEVWDSATGKRTYTLDGRIARRLAFSPDSRRLAAADYQGTITLWDVAPPGEPAIFTDHAAQVLSVAFHPDNRRVASVDLNPDTDQNIRIWDVSTLKTLQQLTTTAAGLKQKNPLHGAYALTFSGDGNRLAAGSLSGMVRVWDTKSWQIIIDLKGLDNEIWHSVAVAFSADDRFLAAANRGRVRVWETATWKEILKYDYPLTVFNDVAWSHRGEQLAFMGMESLQLWNAATRQPPRYLGGNLQASSTLAWSPDDRRLALATSGGNWIDVGDSRSGRLIHRFANSSDMVRKVQWSPDGRRLFSAGQDGTVKVWDTEAGQELLTLRSPLSSTQGFVSLALSRNGRILVASQNNRIYVWEATWD